jgi:hypothetical protein
MVRSPEAAGNLRSRLSNSSWALTITSQAGIEARGLQRRWGFLKIERVVDRCGTSVDAHERSRLFGLRPPEFMAYIKLSRPRNAGSIAADDQKLLLTSVIEFPVELLTIDRLAEISFHALSFDRHAQNVGNALQKHDITSGKFAFRLTVHLEHTIGSTVALKDHVHGTPNTMLN